MYFVFFKKKYVNKLPSFKDRSTLLLFFTVSIFQNENNDVLDLLNDRRQRHLTKPIDYNGVRPFFATF